MKLKKIEKSFGRILVTKGQTTRQTVNGGRYNYRWQQARAAWLAENPLCVRCGALASVLDHVVPHRGDDALFWDRCNWQSLCKACHDRDKQREENRQRFVG